MTPFSSLRLLLLFTLVSGALSYPASSQTGQVWLDHYGIPASEWFFDHDGDSFTADQEYMAGTDPLDPDSSLSLELLPDETTPDEWIVQWQSTLGARYELLGSTGLNDFGSVPPLAGPMAGDGQLAELAIDLTGQDRYFFSLRALQPDDTDDDDLSAIEEALLGTDPGDNDTDGDTLLDGEEVLHYHTDPLVFNDLGGTIRGTLFRDPNVDGDLSDGEPQANVRVYLDSNFNGQLDSGERTETTNASGDYEFLVVPQGLHHVRQELVAPNIQTFPVEGYAVTNNLLPDEVVEYLHSAPGVGNLEEPYGQLALDVPSRWADIDAGPGVQAVPLEILLKPIGVRDVGDHAGRIAYGSEYLSLPTGAAVTVRFDEAIVDGVGPDFIINPYTPGVSTERADVFVGRTIDSLTYIGDYAEGGQYTYIDLADFDIPGPIHFVKLVGKDLGGSTFGFDLAGLTVINFAEPDPSAHAVIVTANEVFEDRDFGRYYRDLPPSLVLGFTAANSAPETPLTGESLEIRVNAFDDLEVSAVSLVANGNALALGPDGLANMIAPNPGMLYLLATATDSGGQTVESSLQIPVRRADGSYPFDTTVVGNGQSVPNAPLVRIVSPLVGEVLSGDTTVMADIVGDPPATQWTIEYASVALIDPYALDLADPDYILLNSGSGNRYSDAVGTLPVASLADGVYFIRICARNSPTRVAYFGQVFAKGVDPLTLRPTITITSPSPGDSVMVVKDIEGMIESPAYPLRDWVVDYAPTVEVNQADLGARGPNWKRLASGTESVPLNAVLATFDATMVKNDSYIVRIVARNEIGLGYAAGLQLEVMGETKLGRNRLEFPDVDLNLAGFPLKFTRIYDSFDSEKNGELGYGWSIQLQDPDIRETVPETGVLGIFGATPLKTGSRIYITAPTGERLGFTFEPERKPVPTKFGYSYNPVFVPDPGNYHQLLPSEARPPLLSIDADGKATIFFIGFPYNPSKYTLVDPEGRRYHYHEKSGLLGAEDLNGNRLSFSENGIEHSSGGGLRFGRDGQGRIISLTDPENNVRLYSYDAAGDLVSTTDADGETTTYQYLTDPPHFLSSVTDSLGRIPVRYEYDPVDGRLVAQIDAMGNRSEIHWDPGSFTGNRTSPRGFTSAVIYNDRGNVIEETDPDGNKTFFQYNDPANPDLETSMTDGNGAIWTYEYNARGQITRLKPPSNSIVPLRPIVREYDSMGNVTRTVDFDSSEGSYAYDEKGNRTRQSIPGQPVETLRYSSEGRPVEISSAPGYTSHLSYDGHGQLAGVTDNLGYTSNVQSDRYGRITSVTNADGNTATFAFNNKSIPTSQTDFTGASTTTSKGAQSDYTTTSPTGHVSSVVFDAEGMPTSATSRTGGTVTPIFDPDGNLISLTDPLGNVHGFTYDFDNRLQTITSPTGGVQTRSYDAVGQLVTLITAEGRKVSFEYGKGRRLRAEKWHASDDSVIRTITYNYKTLGTGNGILQSVVEAADGAITRHVYTDGAGRPTRTTITYPGQTVFNIRYDWSAEGVRLESPAGADLYRDNTLLNGVSAGYAGGRLYRQTWNGAIPAGSNVVEFRRHPDGSLASTTRFDSGNFHSKSLVSYNENALMSSIRHENALGSLIEPRTEITYSYQHGGQLISVADASNTATYTYDTSGHLSGALHSNPARPDESYSYDAVSNRVLSHLSASPNTIGPGNQLLSTGTDIFTYTPGGHVATITNASSGEVREFAYDHRDRLTEVLTKPNAASPPSTTVRFTYDYLNRLISREVNGVKTWILYDRLMPTAEFMDGEQALSAAFFYSLDKVDDFHAVWRSGEGEKWFLKDNLGSVRGILDSTGAFVSWQDYDAFGRALTPLSEPLAFAGRFYNAAIGLYENRRRFYSPEYGRFLSPDPLGFGGGDLNLYAYVGNDPLSFTDPQGTFAAAGYGMLVDLITFYVKGLCKYGNCVGSLYGGVVKGVVEKQPMSRLPIKECVLDFVPGFDDCGNFDPFGTGGLGAGAFVASLNPDRSEGQVKLFKKITKVAVTIEGCSKVSFEIEEIDCGGGGNQ